MLTTNERLANLEAEVVELRAALQIAGALAITTIQSALDEMVDRQFLAASIRTEIFGRIKKELSAIEIGSRELARGARHALPRYPTAEDRAAIKHREAQFRKSDEELRETLRLRRPKPDSDQ